MVFVPFLPSTHSKRYSSVSLVIMLENRRYLSNLRRVKSFNFLRNLQTGSGSNPASCWMGNGGTFLVGIEGWRVRLASLFHPSSAEVRNKWSFTRTVLCKEVTWGVQEGKCPTSKPPVFFSYIRIVLLLICFNVPPFTYLDIIKFFYLPTDGLYINLRKH